MVGIFPEQDSSPEAKTKMCKAYAPGQWMSVCISVKLEENIQEVTYFQDGQLCVETSFKDGDFDWIYFKPPITVGDL